ncbi:MAG: hypothetical protein ASARMPRED_002455 [Alectoria sarmentosa]|nr:MAG: hypothetical protein ASARMPRED_002455 [Alectoria sarmentosa]
MNFLKKAKETMKELEGDLNKATAQLGFGEKSHNDAQAPMAAEPASSDSTPATSNINTPSTSVAPSTTGGAPKTKLPLALLRDEFETKIPELEANLSSVLGQPWKIDFDPGHLHTLADTRFAKESLGQMYCQNATRGISDYVEKYGADGKSELNTVASSHTMTLEQTTNPKISYSGCEISGGMLRLVFSGKYLGSNLSTVCAELATAVNNAGVSTNAGGGAALDFDAKSSIKKDYEPEIANVKAKIQSILGLPMLELHPNFERNFAAIAAYTASGKQATTYPREWKKRIGGNTLMYFQGLISSLEGQGFAKDDMLQEGYQETADKNEIGLRIVDKLQKGTYNECVFENGVMYIQTTPQYWTTNIRDAGNRIMDLL